MNPSTIKVGPRFRREVGDLASLTESIRASGLLHPIVVDNAGNLVAGLRRLRACEALSMADVPVHVVSVNGTGLLAERDENLERLDFLPSELAAIGMAIEEGEREKAKERQARGRKRGAIEPEARSAKLAERDSGNTRDKVAAVANVSHGTYEKARAVVKAANEEPEKYAALVRKMDETGNVHGAFEVLAGRRKDIGSAHVARNTGDNEWYTPEPIIMAARAALGGIDFDPASSDAANKVVKATEYFTEQTDGLAHDWHGRTFMNPPYGQPLCADFCAKMRAEYEVGRVTAAVVLVNNATETNWFQGLAAVASAIYFPRGRIRFWSPDKESASPLQGQAVLYLGTNPKNFVGIFQSLGLVVLNALGSR